MWFGLGVDDGGGVRFHFQDRQHAHRMGHMHGTRWHNKSILATSSKSAEEDACVANGRCGCVGCMEWFGWRMGREGWEWGEVGERGGLRLRRFSI